MENRWRNPGIAEITLQAYAQRHGNDDSNGSNCWRPRAKPIALSIVCTIVISLAIYWLIIGPIFESQKYYGDDGIKNRRDCQR